MVRSFSDEPVDPEVIERIVDAARRGPSAGFSQGIEFVVVTDAELRQELGRLVTNRETASEAIARAPVHILICSSAEIYKSRYRQPDKERVRQHVSDDVLWQIPFWHVDAGAALMLLLLAAVNEGVDAGFIGVWRQDAVRDLLGVPNTYDITGMAMVGHRSDDERPQGSTLSRRRRARDAVVHRERW
jgi:nitroreductase